MNGRVFAIALGLALLVLGGGWYLIRHRPAAPAPDESAVAAPPSSAASPGVPEKGLEAPSPPVSGARSGARTPAPDVAPAEEAAPTTGTLRVTADVPNAMVFLDRVYAGMAPVTIPNIPPGSHRLNVSAEGFEGILRTIDVEAGPADLAVSLREVQLDASVAVTHKHRIGSCSGQLVATPQGLRYETTNRDDAFSVPLTSLASFELDYAAATLRVTLPAGKNFNFTSPSGGAEGLATFHGSVDKARTRLAKGDPPAS